MEPIHVNILSYIYLFIHTHTITVVLRSGTVYVLKRRYRGGELTI